MSKPDKTCNKCKIAFPRTINSTVQLCPLHASVWELLRAIKALLDEHSDCKGCMSSGLAFKAIKRAEGRE